MSKVIICANQKGGVAKTTTTVNLGIGLAREGKKVLVIDNDPQGSLTEALGYQEPDSLETTLAQIMDWVLNEESFNLDAGILHHEEGIDLMPANIELSGVETSLVGIMSSETVLKEYIEMIGNRYDYIIIDCSPNLGQLTLNALVAADEIIIPVQAAYLPIKGLIFIFLCYFKRQVTLDLPSTILSINSSNPWLINLIQFIKHLCISPVLIRHHNVIINILSDKLHICSRLIHLVNRFCLL
ncbi:MAG: AAA family ATPase, partial [Roseburia sp.]|nr:AAA family ATPase [Roseburia sp.]